MNILFVISSLRHGGAEKQTVIDANTFSENNNVFVITFGNCELEDLLNSNVKLIVLEKKGYLKTAKRIRKIIKEKNIQVVNASLFASMVISYLAARNMNIPVLWYFHSHEYDIKFKSKFAFKNIAKSDIIKKIFFVSKELKDSFFKNGYNFPENKLDILYNTITVRNVKKDLPSINNDKIIIGYLGRLVELKRVQYLIELAVYLKENGMNNFRVDIIGDGESRQELVDYMNKSGVSEFVNFLGFKSDVGEYYSKLDVFVLPSREECLSIALIDACASSLPCIAFNVGGNDEIIINNKTGYLVESKVEMFEKVKNLIMDAELRKSFGLEAEKCTKDKFSIKRRREYLENIFTSLN